MATGTLHVRTVGALILFAFLAGCAGPAVDISRSSLAPRDFLTAEGFDWVSDSVGTFRVHAETGTGPARRMEQVKAELADDIAPRIREVLGTGIPGGPVHVFLVEDRDRMRRLIGYGGNAISGDELVVSILPDRWSGLGAHEFTHVATGRLFGPRDGFGAYALNEGVAVFASGAWWGHDLHALAKHLRETDRALTLRELLGNGRAHPETLVYPQAGSFVAFLHRRFGADTLATLLARQYGSEAPRFEAVTGLGLPELETEWQAVVNAADASGIEYEP